MDIRLWIGRLYIPVITLVIVFLVGHWLGAMEKIDPLVAAQNARLKFKTEGASDNRNANNLSAVEASKADAVLTKNRRIEDDRLKLLYIGNSQTLAIMDEHPGDLTTPQWLQILLSRQSSEEVSLANVILASEANMSMTEVFIKLVAAGEQSHRQCDVFLDSAVLEEYRGLGVREEISKAVDRPGVKAKLAALLKANPDLSLAAQALVSFVEGTSETVTAKTAEGSIAGRLENRLQMAAERNPFFANRSDLQIRIGISFLALRNKLLRINSTTARPVPESSYRTSLELLEMSLRYAQAKGIHVVLYLAPIRPVQPNPNLAVDIARFRWDVPALCRRYGAVCLDYVDLVPENLWTNYSDQYSGGQRDFAHFTGAAHKLVAEKLIGDIGPQLKLWAQDRQTARR